MGTLVVQDRDTLKDLVTRAKGSLADMLPKHLTVDRVMKMALVAASRQPKLFECTKESFLQAIMKSSELGLDFTGTLGSGYLVPYFNSRLKAYECQFILGYKGMIELAMRSGKVKKINSQVVFINDKFKYVEGLNPILEHEPQIDGDRGAFRCVYAVVHIEGTEPQIEVMTKDQIEGIKARSKASSGPWVTDYNQMARKTVIRRVFNYIPSSVELQRGTEIDQEFDDNINLNPEPLPDDKEDTDTRTKTERLADELDEAERSKGVNKAIDKAKKTTKTEDDILTPEQRRLSLTQDAMTMVCKMHGKDGLNGIKDALMTYSVYTDETGKEHVVDTLEGITDDDWLGRIYDKICTSYNLWVENSG